MRVVVMGGTSGIGLATAEKCAADGAEVTVTGRDPERLRAAAEKVASAEAVDGTSEDEVRGFFARYGRFDHLVLALSGAGGAGALRDLKVDDLRAGFEGKFFPHVLAAKSALDTIAEDGSITFVTVGAHARPCPAPRASRRSTARSSAPSRRSPPSWRRYG